MKKPPNDGRPLNKRIFMDEVAKVLALVLWVLRLTVWFIKKLQKLS
jgi:hypothetical protein